jgi:hypothetical protein
MGAVSTGNAAQQSTTIFEATSTAPWSDIPTTRLGILFRGLSDGSQPSGACHVAACQHSLEAIMVRSRRRELARYRMRVLSGRNGVLESAGGWANHSGVGRPGKEGNESPFTWVWMNRLRCFPTDG